MTSLVALGTVAGAAAAQTSGAFGLHDGDRVVFYGDSITDQRLYTVFTEDYVLTRFPGMKVTFTHSGWGGDTVGGGGGGPIDLRIKRDVLPYRPTVMTIMLAMNDAGYAAFDEGRFQNYTRGYEHIIRSVQAAFPDCRFTLIQPSPYDDVTRDPKFPGGYNAVLVRYGDWVKETAVKDHQNVADLNTPVVAMLTQAKAIDQDQSQKLLPDRVHPSPGGHLIMAEALLKAWNAPSLVARVEIDASRKKVVHADNADVRGLTTGNAVAWDETDGALPFIVDPGDALVQLALKSSDVTAALNQEPLIVAGLAPEKNYTLRIDDSDVADLTGAQLASGVNLATLSTPMSRQAQMVLSLTRQHDDQHFQRWRSFEVPLASHSPEVQQALPPLLKAFDDEEAQTVEKQRAATQPVRHHYEIVAALPAPTGPNLALHKPYMVSDPNNYGWGIGGLTDGSFEASPQHAFATGDNGSFPKSATIDLGASSKIGAVVLGVPGFGSTKTVAISTSEDGQTFTDVGHYAYPLGVEQKHTFRFPAVSARYVRLTYVDHYDEERGYSVNFGFATEAEVYGVAQ